MIGNWWTTKGSADPLDMIIREVLAEHVIGFGEVDVIDVARAVRDAVDKAGYIRTSTERLFWEQPDLLHEPQPMPAMNRTLEIDDVVSRTY